MNTNLIDSEVHVIKCPISELSLRIEEFLTHKKMYKREIWKVNQYEIVDRHKPIILRILKNVESIVTVSVHFICIQKLSIIEYADYLSKEDKKYTEHLFYIRRESDHNGLVVYLFGYFIPLDGLSVETDENNYKNIRVIDRYELWNPNETIDIMVRNALLKTKPELSTRFKIITEYLLRFIEDFLNSNELYQVKDL